MSAPPPNTEAAPKLTILATCQHCRVACWATRRPRPCDAYSCVVVVVVVACRFRQPAVDSHSTDKVSVVTERSRSRAVALDDLRYHWLHRTNEPTNAEQISAAAGTHDRARLDVIKPSDNNYCLLWNRTRIRALHTAALHRAFHVWTHWPTVRHRSFAYNSAIWDAALHYRVSSGRSPPPNHSSFSFS